MPDRQGIPPKTPPIDPWWDWLGSFGSAKVTPSRSIWGPLPSTPPASDEEEPEPWELAGFPNKKDYLKAQPWKKLYMARTQYEDYLRSQAMQVRTKALESVKPPVVSDEAEARKLGMSLEEYRQAKRRQAFPEYYESLDRQKKLVAEQEQLAWQKQSAEEKEKTRQAMAYAEASQAQYNREWAARLPREPGTAETRAQERGDLKAQQMALWDAQARSQLQGFATGFEQLRSEIMATTAPREWVVREKARLAINPYQERLRTFTGYQGVGSGGIPTANPFLTQIPSRPLEERYTGIPQVPGVVQSFMGKEKSFGTPIEPPSGQAWAAAPWSAKEALVGYSEALGLPEADLLGAMLAMRPNAPERGISWAPARRR